LRVAAGVAYHRTMKRRRLSRSWFRRSVPASEADAATIMTGPEPPARTGTRAALRAYSEAPWLRAVVGKVAESVASVPWELWAAKDGATGRYIMPPRSVVGAQHPTRAAVPPGVELEQVFQHPLLDILAGGGLDAEVEPVAGLAPLPGSQLLQVTQAHIDLAGEAFWILYRDGLGVPRAAFPLPPSAVTRRPAPRDPVFHVLVGGESFTIPPSEVIWFKTPNPADPIGRGAGLGEAVLDEVDADELAARHITSYFHNRGIPPLVVSGEGLTPDQTQRLEETWLAKTRGFWRRYLPVFMRTKVEVKELASSFRDMQLVELRQFQRDIIRQLYGVPPEMLGLVEHSNRATITMAEQIMGRWVVLPRLRLLASTIQALLVPEYDERLIVAFASPVPEDENRHVSVARAAPWSRTIDEWRALQGLPPLPGGQGRVLAIPKGYDLLAVEDS